jgi:ATP-dependent DNA helicase DinG
MNKSDIAREALAAFDRVVAAHGGLRAREGQRRMAEQVAHTLAQADLGPWPPPSWEEGPTEAAPARSIAVIQAGTGVGKSLAYSAVAVSIALARQARVVISTATVALQEQLVHKDLPALAALMPEPFRFALAKGRGRYVCKLKLDRLTHKGPPDANEPDDEPPEEEDLFGFQNPGGLAGGAPDWGQCQDGYEAMADELASGRWDGDRDAWPLAPDPAMWQAVAADVNSCAARHCPAYGECSYFLQRKALVGAQVIVVNHDLLLSALGSRALPELDQSLLVLDEAHHLPTIALDRFASHMDLNRLQWLDRLSSRAQRVGGTLGVEEVAEIPRHAAALRQAMQAFAQQATHHFALALEAPAYAGAGAEPVRRARVPEGHLPPEMVEPLERLAHCTQGYLEALRAISKALRAEMRDRPEQARRLATQYAQLGAWAPRLEAVHATTRGLLPSADGNSAPVAKWFSVWGQGEATVWRAHVSPIWPASPLRQRLWAAVRGAVLTSATLTSCGRFDFLLRDIGLQDDPDVVTLEVPSPFDFGRQGRLVLASTRADPKDAARFTPEMVQALIRDLHSVRHGALVLFTSREQMRQATEALPAQWRDRVLVQNDMPRLKLLQRHAQRVAEGLPSIVFGMQSFGEGLDLPGRLCEGLFITKLPFMPPDDPVGEARAEWLRSAGRDPFMELVLPATAIRLAQWVGRAIRTESDEAHVYCYDRRLTQTPYGQRLLAGLPPFAQVHAPPP